MTDKKQPVSYYFRNGGIRSGKKYKPNRVPLFTRICLIVFSLLLFTSTTHDLFIKGSGALVISSAGAQIHDMPGLMFYAAIVCACVLMLAHVIDHYDKRNNEEKYALLAENLILAFSGFFILAMIMLITAYDGSLKQLLKILVFFLPIVFLTKLMFNGLKTGMKEHEIRCNEWKNQELQDLKKLSTGLSENQFSLFGNIATTMQYTETPLGDEYTVTGLEIKRILRNHWGEYFLWIWRTNSHHYLKHITQVNAKIILKKDYIAPNEVRTIGTE